MAGEGLLLASRELAYLLISNSIKMETTIISAKIYTNAETSSRMINLVLDDEIDFIDAANGFVHGKRNLLKMSMKQFMHFSNENTTDLGDDIAFMLMATSASNLQIEDLLTGATISLTQTERTAGEQYTDGDGNVSVAEYDSIHTSEFAITKVSKLGQFAIDYDGKPEDYLPNNKARKAIWIAARKANRA